MGYQWGAHGWSKMDTLAVPLFEEGLQKLVPQYDNFQSLNGDCGNAVTYEVLCHKIFFLLISQSEVDFEITLIYQEGRKHLWILINHIMKNDLLWQKPYQQLYHLQWILRRGQNVCQVFSWNLASECTQCGHCIQIFPGWLA